MSRPMLAVRAALNYAPLDVGRYRVHVPADPLVSILINREDARPLALLAPGAVLFCNVGDPANDARTRRNLTRQRGIYAALSGTCPKIYRYQQTGQVMYSGSYDNFHGGAVFWRVRASQTGPGQPLDMAAVWSNTTMYRAQARPGNNYRASSTALLRLWYAMRANNGLLTEPAEPGGAIPSMAGILCQINWRGDMDRAPWARDDGEEPGPGDAPEADSLDGGECGHCGGDYGDGCADCDDNNGGECSECGRTL